MWWPTCNYNTCTSGHRANFLILLMMGAWRPKHVERLCRNKTCTVLHQVGVLFDLYYDARKHKSKTSRAFTRFYLEIENRKYQWKRDTKDEIHVSCISGTCIRSTRFSQRAHTVVGRSWYEGSYFIWNVWTNFSITSLQQISRKSVRW